MATAGGWSSRRGETRSGAHAGSSRGSASIEREAVRLERQLRLQAQGSVVGNITLARLVGEWWANKPRLAPTTQANYRDNIDKHIIPTLGDKRVSDIRPRLVAAFLQRLSGRARSQPGDCSEGAHGAVRRAVVRGGHGVRGVQRRHEGAPLGAITGDSPELITEVPHP